MPTISKKALEQLRLEEHYTQERNLNRYYLAEFIIKLREVRPKLTNKQIEYFSEWYWLFDESLFGAGGYKIEDFIKELIETDAELREDRELTEKQIKKYITKRIKNLKQDILAAYEDSYND